MIVSCEDFALPQVGEQGEFYDVCCSTCHHNDDEYDMERLDLNIDHVRVLVCCTVWAWLGEPEGKLALAAVIAKKREEADGE